MLTFPAEIPLLISLQSVWISLGYTISHHQDRNIQTSQRGPALVEPSTRTQNKVISSSLFSLPGSSSLHPHLNGQIKTWHPEINWKKRDQRCLCWAGQKYHSEVRVSPLVCATKCNWLESTLQYIFLSYNSSSCISYTSSDTCKKWINQDENQSQCSFWMLPTHWGVICYCRWPLTSPVFPLMSPRWRRRRLSDW